MFNPFRRKSKENASTTAVPKCGSNADLLGRIVPVIKLLEANDGTSPHLDLPAGDLPVSQPFAGDLIVMYAEDLPEHYAFLSERKLAELGLDMEALHLLAIDNLAARVPPIQLHGSAPRFMITAGGNVEATLLLHPTLWESLADHLPGAPVALAPARDLLFVTSTEWEDGRAFLKEMAGKEFEDKRHALSTSLFIRRNGAWTVDGPDA